MKGMEFAVNTTSLLSLNFLAWWGCTLLYSLSLSYLLVEVDVTKVYIIGLSTPLVFLAGYIFAHMAFTKSTTIKTKKIIRIIPSKLTRQTMLLTSFFFALVLFEFIYSGYVPLISMISGVRISHFDFGLPGLHGMILSIGALLFTMWFFIYYISNNKRALAWALIILIVFALMVTRKMIVVSVLQAVLLAFFLRDNNKVVFKYAIVSLLVLIVFGVVGDIRTGRELFLSLANFTVKYPEWLPTGFGWVYIYMTTPILNLVSGIDTAGGITYDLSFMKGLLPSFLREFFFEVDNDAFDNDWQVSGAFNVATGFLGIYFSFGYLGVIIFNFVLGFIYKLIITKITDIKLFLVTIVFSALTLLMLFTNNFFNLNTVSQMIFIYVLFGTVTLFKRYGGTRK